MGLELKFLAVFGILCGIALSFFNYFRVIFGGGVGKNGSTIAVSCFKNLRGLSVLYVRNLLHFR